MILVVIRRASLLAAGVALALCLAGAVGVPVAVKQLDRPGPLAGRTVALDPGHGGVDGGACNGQCPLLEKDITLDVSQRLGKLLRSAGAAVVMTRTDDSESDLPDRQELDRRAKIAVDAKADIFLSIHVNSHADSTAFGGETFYSPNSPESQRLAELVQEELLLLQTENFRQSAPQNHRVLVATTMPAALVELGFLSNPDDRATLVAADGRQDLAAAICRAVHRFFANEKPNRIIR